MAAGAGHAKAIEVLLRNGADVGATDDVRRAASSNAVCNEYIALPENHHTYYTTYTPTSTAYAYPCRFPYYPLHSPPPYTHPCF